MKPEEVLEGAIEILERDGWHQGELYEGETTDPSNKELAETAPVCAMGALSRAAFGTASASFATIDNSDAYLGAHQRLRSITPGMVAVWNDDPTTTKEDVILALKKAAADDT